MSKACEYCNKIIGINERGLWSQDQTSVVCMGCENTHNKFKKLQADNEVLRALCTDMGNTLAVIISTLMNSDVTHGIAKTIRNEIRDKEIVERLRKLRS